MKKEYIRTKTIKVTTSLDMIKDQVISNHKLEIDITRTEWNTIFAKSSDAEKAFRSMFLEAEQEGIFTLCGVLPIQVHDIYNTRRFLSEMDTRMYAEHEEILTDEQKDCLKGLIIRLDLEARTFMGGLFKSLYQAEFPSSSTVQKKPAKKPARKLRLEEYFDRHVYNYEGDTTWTIKYKQNLIQADTRDECYNKFQNEWYIYN